MSNRPVVEKPTPSSEQRVSIGPGRILRSAFFIAIITGIQEL